jgi:hypothetical protein
LKNPYIHINSPTVGEKRYLCAIDSEKVVIGINPIMIREFPPALICPSCRAIHEYTSAVGADAVSCSNELRAEPGVSCPFRFCAIH